MLTAKQEEFAKKIAEGMTQADAYRFAYDTSRLTDKTVWEKASVLAANNKVRERVQELRDMAAKPSILTAQQRLEWLTSLIQDEQVSIGDKLKASDQMNKMQGEYVQKIEADIPRAVNISIELSDD